MAQIYRLILSILVFISLSFVLVSANTFVIGKVYNTNFNNPVSGASISVTCQGNTKTTTSLNDGAYGIGFEVSECADKSSVSITATKDNLYGSSGGEIDNSNETDYFTVKNIVMTVQSSDGDGGGSSGGGSSGGGGGSFYLCGNGVCDSGETPSLCPQDCKIEENKEVENNTTSQNVSLPETGGGAGITGGVIGALGTAGTVALLFILLVVIATLLVYLRKQKKKKE